MSSAGAAPRRSATVVIPAYQAEADLASALSSVCAQTQPPDEVIVVDDGSSDGTFDLARSFEDLLPLTVLRNDFNKGAGAARAMAIEKATSELIALLDADDFLLPNHLELMCETYGGPSTIVSARSLVWDEAAHTIGRAKTWDSSRPAPEDQRLAILRWNFVSIAALFDREACLAAGNFQARLVEDWELWIRMIRAGARVVAPASATFIYRSRPSSTSRSGKFGVLPDATALLEELMPTFGADERAVAQRSVRGRRALMELLAARDLVAEGRYSEARRSYARAAWLQRSFGRIAAPSRTPMLRAMAGIVVPRKAALSG